jgi:hypothetical protein
VTYLRAALSLAAQVALVLLLIWSAGALVGLANVGYCSVAGC